ncbi:MAG: NUDIX domain-containing protein [Woeseiaceae bacterium]|nr:NUDIX domain-containing protein [Woeseiaceae bacterium]
MSYTYEYPHPAVTVDVAIFSIRHDALNVLLIKRALAPYQGEWALPGGFVEIDEALEHAAARELKEETGVDAGYLEQLYTFGRPDRDPRERVISVTYFALIPSDRLEIRAASDAEGVGWFPVASLPELAFDHAEILDTAFERLKAKLDYSTIAFQLMPATFTMPELRHVYEVITREEIDKRNFSKKILGLGVIEPTGEEKREGAHRPAKLYRVIDRSKVDVIK